MRFNLWILLGAAAIIYFLYLIREDILQHKDLYSEKEKLAQKIGAIIAENQTLARTLAEVGSVKSVERLARERLNLIKKGEIAYKVCQ